jgi:hypothetical protein
MIIVNYGMGTNSTALLVEATRRGIIVDLVVASDTGDEFKRTYDYSKMFSEWLVAHGQPPVTMTRWTRQDGTFIPISTLSLARKELPSKAYGYSGCTSKWKQQPVDRLVRDDAGVRACWARGELVERWIGYDVDEPSRAERMLAKNPQPTRQRGGKTEIVPSWKWRCPLVEWDMGRDECVASITAAGLDLPGKSACFMCPSTKRHEIDKMAIEEPEALRRALEIEDAARSTGELRTVLGLGRSFAWRDYLEGKAKDARDTVEEECGCYDGEAANLPKGYTDKDG